MVEIDFNAQSDNGTLTDSKGCILGLEATVLINVRK